MTIPQLDDIDTVFELVSADSKNSVIPEIGSAYCPRCAGPRRMHVEILFSRPVPTHISGMMNRNQFISDRGTLPAFLEYVCLQCSARFSVLLDDAPVTSGRKELRLIVLPRVSGGLSTPNTPSAVAYYLDQAYRSHCIGANSAAVSMFRAAVEFLLFEQGYTDRMLGPKIRKLESDKASGAGPGWVRDLDPEFVKVLGQLGNAAIHPGDGDITKQDALDRELLAHVEATVIELLDLVYEAPTRRSGRLAALKAAATTFKK